jgi:hypothetical protein
MNEHDYSGHIPEQPAACSTCCAAALELAELKGYLRGISVVAERNLARLDELLGQARDAHAKEER